MSETKFTDPDFLTNFQKECIGNPIGPTEMMIYHMGKAILKQMEGNASVVLNDFGLLPASIVTATADGGYVPPEEAS
jgi:hypothetical protein